MIIRLYARQPGEHTWALIATFGNEKEVQSFMKHLPPRLVSATLRIVNPKGVGTRLA